MLCPIGDECKACNLLLYTTISFLINQEPQVRKAFVIGSAGLEEELCAVGIECVGAADPLWANMVCRT